MLTSGQRRSPRRRSQDVAAVIFGLACLGATFCALVRPSDEKTRGRELCAALDLYGGTVALARRGVAVWDRVPRAGVVKNDVAILPEPSRAAGSETARNAMSSSDPKIVDFRASQVAAWAV